MSLRNGGWERWSEKQEGLSPRDPWVCLLVGVEPIDTAKPKIRRRKEMLFLVVSKESMGNLSQSSVSLDSKIGGGSAGEESAYNAGDLGSIPGLGRSPGEGNCYPLQYSGLENSMDCIVHRVTELDTTEQLSLSLLS